MAIKLSFIEGLRKGDEFIVKEDITIGRSMGDLEIKDKKVSNPHVRIVIGEGNSIEIEDLGSSNGTLLNSNKIKKARAFIGDVLQVGGSKIRLEKFEPKGGAKAALEANSWQSVFSEKLDEATKSLELIPRGRRSFEAFSHPMEIEVFEGPQAGQTFIVAFGPRAFGRLVPESLLWGSSIQPVAFEFQKGQSSDWQINPVSGDVLLNDKKIQGPSAVKEGDVVRVSNYGMVIKKAGV